MRGVRTERATQARERQGGWIRGERVRVHSREEIG